MAARDSYGFPLLSLTKDEDIAREKCLVGGAAESLAKAWFAHRDLVKSFALNPTVPVPKKLKQLVRGGLPAAQRPRLWLELSGGMALQQAQAPKFYEALVREVDSTGSPKSVISRAELELFNPFPAHAVLPSMKGMHAVRRVVLAHAHHCNSSEYAQGISSVAGFLLAVMGLDLEEEAFWTLVALTRYRLHSAYFEELRGCRVEQRVLGDLARRKVQRVQALFDSLDTPLNAVTGEWMVYLFTHSLPAEATVRVWDCLLTEGPKSLHRAGLSLLKLHEASLLSTCKGSLKLGQVLKWRVARTYDADLLMKVAYRGLGSLQGGVISSLRASHEAVLLADQSDLATRLSSFVRAVSPPRTASGGTHRTAPPSRSTSSGSLGSGGDHGASEGGRLPLQQQQQHSGPPTAASRPVLARLSGTAALGQAAGAARPPAAPKPPAEAKGPRPDVLVKLASPRLLLAGAWSR